MISAERRREILSSLRRGTVPARGLGTLAVGLARLEGALGEELEAVTSGQGVFKAVRGEYGCGKTFFARWLQERGRDLGFASSEVQISETDTPLHRLETVYRRLVEHLTTSSCRGGAFRSVIDAWFYTLEEDVLAEKQVDPNDSDALFAAGTALMEKRLAEVTRQAPAFSAALRGYRAALHAQEPAIAEGLIAWLSGLPNVGAPIKRYAGLKGDLDHYGALSFLRGLLVILRDSGFSGLIVVLDEVETLQRVRTDVRDKGLNSLRQWIDEVDRGTFPGLYLAVTGTTSFFEGPHGVPRLPPLASRLATDFGTDARFDNPRAIQIRLQAFDQARLVEVGQKVRDLYRDQSKVPERILEKADDGYVADLALAVAGSLAGKVGLAPRIFLKKLVSDVLDRIDLFPDFEPRRDYALTVSEAELEPHERQLRAANPDDVALELD